MSDRDISTTLDAIANTLAARPTLTSSESLGLHCLRAAARFLFKERTLHAEWHQIVHGFFALAEIADPQSGRHRYIATMGCTSSAYLADPTHCSQAGLTSDQRTLISSALDTIDPVALRGALMWLTSAKGE